MPNSAPSRTSDSTSAARSIALAGMQASFRQRPPSSALLHDRRLHAELGGADRRHVAAGAAPDHDHVVACPPRRGAYPPDLAGGRRSGIWMRASAFTRNQNSVPAAPMIASASDDGEHVLGLDQEQRPDDDQEREQGLEAEHRPVARVPHARPPSQHQRRVRRACPTLRARCPAPRRRPRTATSVRQPPAAPRPPRATVTASGRSPSSSGTSCSRAMSSFDLALRRLPAAAARPAPRRPVAARARRLRLRAWPSRRPAHLARAEPASRGLDALADALARGARRDRRRRGSRARPRPARRRRRRTSSTLPASMPPIAKNGTRRMLGRVAHELEPDRLVVGLGRSRVAPARRRCSRRRAPPRSARGEWVERPISASAPDQRGAPRPGRRRPGRGARRRRRTRSPARAGR